MNGDWLAQSMERVQASQREVRMTLPPGQHALFWNMLLERARLIQDRLTFHMLLPADPVENEGLSLALDALLELEQTRHVVSLSAGRPFPFFLLLTDRDAALAVVGDAFNGDDAPIVQSTDDIKRVTDFADSFDRRFDEGIREPDLAAWRTWLNEFPRRKDARSALSMLQRGRAKLERATRRSLKSLPKRRFWLIKPSPAAWGMEERDGLAFEFWLQHMSLHLGWPKLAASFSKSKTIDLATVKKALAKTYSGVEDAARVRATADQFLHVMHERDRIIAMDGWTPAQETPVHVYAWGKIAGEATQTEAAWPIARPVQWRELDLKIPVRVVRECTRLRSATYPLHRLPADAYRDLVTAAESRASKVSAPQLSLTLDLFANLDDQPQLF